MRGLLKLPPVKDPACAGHDPEAWFSFNDQVTEQARNICRRCPAIRSCLAWALTHNELGVWGGTTPEQRTQLLAQNQQEVPPA